MSAITVHMSNTGNLQGYKILVSLRKTMTSIFFRLPIQNSNIHLKMQNSKRGNVQVV